jgi:hypothetical protein
MPRVLPSAPPSHVARTAWALAVLGHKMRAPAMHELLVAARASMRLMDDRCDKEKLVIVGILYCQALGFVVYGLVLFSTSPQCSLCCVPAWTSGHLYTRAYHPPPHFPHISHTSVTQGPGRRPLGLCSA